MRTTCICSDCIEEFTVIHEKNDCHEVIFCPFCSFELENDDDLFFEEEED